MRKVVHFNRSIISKRLPVIRHSLDGLRGPPKKKGVMDKRLNVTKNQMLRTQQPHGQEQQEQQRETTRNNNTP